MKGLALFSKGHFILFEWWPLMVVRGGGETLGNFHKQYYEIIDLKALGNYSAPDWFHKIAILLF